MLAETFCIGRFSIIKIDEVLTLTSNIEELEDIVNNLLKKKQTHIAIHFSEGSYLCSSSGAVLVRCWENIKDHNGTMALVNVNQDIKDFLAIIDFDSLIKTCANVEELESLV